MLSRSILTEEEYKQYIKHYLIENQGYIERHSRNYDCIYAIDKEILFNFLWETQEKTMISLSKIYKENLETTIVNCLNNEALKQGSSILSVLKNGINIDGFKLKFLYQKPVTSFNNVLNDNYLKNKMSIMEEVVISERERVDLVVFVNGIAIISIELKCDAEGTTYLDAQRQYKQDRDPDNRLFKFKAGCLVNFAMDLSEVYMTTRLNREQTVFLPFNMGNGKGIDAGAGNPIFDDKLSTAYMWERILSKDKIIDLIFSYIFIEIDEKTKDESLIFPRFHQYDGVESISLDILNTDIMRNYLIQHSAGSGKTKTLAWLAKKMSSLHNAQNQPVFDTIIIATDRVTVDRQLQRAVKQLNPKTGSFKVIDDSCNSSDLADAINGNYKIIVTTLQKFLYITELIKNSRKKKFLVIIDEAHSSTSGKDMDALRDSLSKSNTEYDNVNDFIEDYLQEQTGKLSNVSFVALTATPKPTTLQLFGSTDIHGNKVPFHTYSMKQAIEEGFILDVLENYITYDTYYQLNKEIEEDPTFHTKEAKKQISRIIDCHDDNIKQRVSIIVEHFFETIYEQIDFTSKAMAILPSREAAVKFYFELKKHLEEIGKTDIDVLVAFSGKVKIGNEEYTESKLNGFSESKLPLEFKKDKYKFLVVADKYQTGFDEKLLCAIYNFKKMFGIKAVQSLLRIDRPIFKDCNIGKTPFILDFANTYEDILNAFAPYYTSTILENSFNENNIRELEEKIDAHNIVSMSEIDEAVNILFKKEEERETSDMTRLLAIYNRARQSYRNLDSEPKIILRRAIKGFIRFYEFIIKASNVEDIELHKKYLFYKHFIKFIPSPKNTNQIDLTDKITVSNFQQKKKTVKKTKIIADPIIKLPIAEIFTGLNEDKVQRLSEIIADINLRAGRDYDKDASVKMLLQLRDHLVKSEELKNSALSNSQEDFSYTYYDVVDIELSKCLQHSNDFFSLLLNNKDYKKELLDILLPEIYNNFK